MIVTRPHTNANNQESSPWDDEQYAEEVLEEGFRTLARVVANQEDLYPKPEDKPSVFASKRTEILNKMVPMSIVPLATSNAMLVMGSHKKTGPDGDCYFPLPQFLIWAGAISLSLITVGWALSYYPFQTVN